MCSIKLGISCSFLICDNKGERVWMTGIDYEDFSDSIVLQNELWQSEIN